MAATTPPSDSIAIPRSALRRAGVAAAAVVALVIVALLIAAVARAVNPSDPLAASLNPRECQAVFLTNGQVYFGKMTAPGGDFYYLRHVYYLSTTKNARTLLRLTNDVHAPEDEVVINRASILYVENLRPSGKASQLIGKCG
jgi:hypothetical protein